MGRAVHEAAVAKGLAEWLFQLYESMVRNRVVVECQYDSPHPPDMAHTFQRVGIPSPSCYWLPEPTSNT